MKTKLYLMMMFCLMSVCAADAADEVRWAINTGEGALVTITKWKGVADYFGKELGRQVKIFPIPQNEIYERVQKEHFDFYLTTSGQAVFLEKKLGVIPLSQQNDTEGGTRYGGIILVRKGSGITKSADLKGKKVISFGKAASAAYLFQVYHLYQQGIDPYKDFAKFDTEGKKAMDMILAVKSGLYDATFMRTKVIEDLAKEGIIRMDDFDIVDKKTDPTFPYLHTTALYPNWCMSGSPKSDPALIKRIREIALKLPQDSEAAKSAEIKGFSEPIPLDDLHAVMKKMKVPPYDE